MSSLNQALADLYASELAVDGRYYPADGAPPLAIRVMKKEADTAIDGFAARAVVAGIRLAVLQAAVPNPRPGDTLSRIETAGGPERLYDITGKPEADGERLEWFLTVSERS